MPDFVIELINNLGADAGDLNIEYRGAAVTNADEEQLDLDAVIPPQHIPTIVNDDIPERSYADNDVGITWVMEPEQDQEPELEPELEPGVNGPEYPSDSAVK
jgi:hypothetical protein